jgi:hypothetical protein
VPGSPAIGVEARHLTAKDIELQEPPALANVAAIADEVAAALRTADVARLFSSAERLAADGKRTEAAMAYALALARGPTGDARAEFARSYLAWRLP